MPYVYILRCADDSFDVGSTCDVEARAQQHADGKGAAYTRRRLPVELVWFEECSSIDEAFVLEKQVQGWGRAKRIALIEGRFADLPALSRPKHSGQGG